MKSYLITFVGERQQFNDGRIMPDTPQANIYTVDANPDERYLGLETSDAPMQYLLQKAGAVSEGIRIIAIVSKKVYTKGADGQSPYDRFRINVENFAGNLGLSHRFSVLSDLVPVFYDFDPNRDGVGIDDIHERTSRINSEIYHGIILDSPGAEKSVFVDFTSGFRDISFLMLTIIQFLRFHGIRLERVVYSNYWEKKIYSLMYVTGINELISAVNSFSLTGNVRQLKRLFDDDYMRGKFETGDNAELGEMKAALDAFDRFFGCVSINNVNEIDMHKAAIEKHMARIRAFENSANMYVSMFSRLFEIIQRQFFLDGSREISYPNLIRWCLNHDFVNQAISLYVEKMPEEYFKSPLIRSVFDPDQPQAGHTGYGKGIYGDGFYTGVMDNLFQRFSSRDGYMSDARMMQVFSEALSDFRDSFLLKLKRTAAAGGSILAESVRQNLLKHLNQIIKRKTPDGGSGGLMAAAQRFDSFLKKHYDGDGMLVDTPSFYSCINQPPNRKVESFINSVCCHVDLQHFFAVHDEERYIEYRRIAKNTYLKKLKQIGEFCQHADLDRQSVVRLGNLMKMYLYAKTLRNRINHAQDSALVDRSELETQQKVLEECSRGDFGLIAVDPEFSFESIRKMLLQGVGLPLP